MAKLKDRYANALLELSEEKATLESDLEQAIIIRDTLNDKDVQAFLEHPYIEDSTKKEFFNKIFPRKLSKHLMGFLYLMVKKSRERLIIPVLVEYIKIINRRFGKIEAKVVSSKELTEKQIMSVKELLSKQTNMQVELKAKVDPDVIGGFYILIDGHIFDGTIRSKLNTMREQIKRGSYE